MLGLISGTGVLVHCGGGVGRSGAITVAAVMKDQGLNADDALALVKQYRHF
jgi:protein-tyrosine phosphatase